MTYELADVMPAAKPKRRRWLVPVIVAAVLLVGATVGLTLWLNRDLTVHVTVQLGGDQITGSATECWGRGPVADVAEGAQLTVTGPDGTVLAIASLPAGHQIWAYECDFALDIAVPRGKDIYGFSMGSHGITRIEEKDLAEPVVLAFRS